MKKLLTGNWIILIIGISFVISTFLAIRNNYVIENNHSIQKQSDLVKEHTREILTQTMHGLDLGVRGFGLTRDEKLLIPYNEAVRETSANMVTLDSLLAIQQYPGREQLASVRREVDRYISFCAEMITLAKNGHMSEFSDALREDKGYKVWASYTEFATPLSKFEADLMDKSVKDYQHAIRNNLIIQIVMLILVMPMLYLFVSTVNRERKRRAALLKEVDTTDRTYVFNPGFASSNEQDINQRAIEHVKRASEFISAIAAGNYNVEWKGMTREVQAVNKQTLVGNLLNLRERLVTVKQEDDRRSWSNQALAEFLELVRLNQQNAAELAVKSISYLTRAINAQQGSLFVVEGDADDKHLRLAGCYAFNKQKFLEKRIEIGAGLVGQTYLEGEPVLMKQIPKGYVSITSGLGDATPTCLVIIPMKYNEEVLAIAEFATFDQIENHQIAFLVKAGEYLAAAITSTRTTMKMSQLLEEANVRELEMRQREEELRQNMEELQATQEELVRKQQEYTFQKSA